MKVQTLKKEFQPVTITLESPIEVDRLMIVLRASRGNMDDQARAQTFREDMISQLANHVQVLP